jgi:hypothetical protein
MKRGLAAADEAMVYRDATHGFGGFMEGAIYGDTSSNPTWEARAGRFISGFTTYGDMRDVTSEYMNYEKGSRSWGDLLRFSGIVAVTLLPGALGGARKADPLDFVPSASNVEDVFARIEGQRPHLGLPSFTGVRKDDGVATLLMVRGQEVFGRNTWAEGDEAARALFEEAGLRNISGKIPYGALANHAEGDAFLQAFKSGLLDRGHATMFVDTTLCGFCGYGKTGELYQNVKGKPVGGILQLFQTTGLESLEVIQRLPGGNYARLYFQKNANGSIDSVVFGM